MSTFKFMTYKEWIAEHPEVEQEQEECTDCGGEGEAPCPHCGHMTDCEECYGSGYIKTARDLYEKQLAIDKAAVEKWQKLMEKQPA